MLFFFIRFELIMILLEKARVIIYFYFLKGFKEKNIFLDPLFVHGY